MALWRPSGQTQTEWKGEKVPFTKNHWKVNWTAVKYCSIADPSKTTSYRDVVGRKKQFCECNEVNFPPILNVRQKKERARFVKRIHNTAILWAIARAIYSTGPLQWLHSYGTFCKNWNKFHLNFLEQRIASKLWEIEISILMINCSWQRFAIASLTSPNPANSSISNCPADATQANAINCHHHHHRHHEHHD